MCEKCGSDENVERFLINDKEGTLYHCMCACGEEWIE